MASKREISDKFVSELRFLKNLVLSTFTHPRETTLLERESGRTLGHYEQESAHLGQYGLINSLKLAYTIAKESVLHPKSHSDIDTNTLKITRY